jgi:flagella basal body P-ring formation protein FlgA
MLLNSPGRVLFCLLTLGAVVCSGLLNADDSGLDNRIGIQQFARQSLLDRLSNEPGRFEIEIIKAKHNRLGEYEPKSLRVLKIAPSKIARRMFVKLTYLTKDGFKQDVMSWFQVKQFKQVMVASRKLDGNQVIDPGDFDLDEVDVLAEGMELVGVPVIGKLLQKGQAQGSVLRKSNVVDKPLILEGELIKVITRNRGITITSRAVALENSSNDGFVTVRVDKAEGSIRTKVIKPGVVQNASL